MSSTSRSQYALYKDRPEWSDVTPVSQDDGGRNIVRIAYSERFADAHDYLRAVLLKDERSERAMDLTTDVLILNPANYTVWEYRRRILTALGADLHTDLRFVGKLIDEHSKNYQLWHHRQWLVEQLACQAKRLDPEKFQQIGLEELEFISSILSDDTKNYHAWQHRRWVICYFQIIPKHELDYTNELIRMDVYNNSAWNHRFTIVSHDEGLSPDVLHREVKFAQEMIRLAPKCESAWNYLYGLLVPPALVIVPGDETLGGKRCLRKDAADRVASEIVDETAENSDNGDLPIRPSIGHSLSTKLCELRRFAEELAATQPEAADSPALYSFLVEVYTDSLSLIIKATTSRRDGDLASNKINEDVSPESMDQLIDLAMNTCDRLATELDRVRCNYWQYRARQLANMYEDSKLHMPS